MEAGGEGEDDNRTIVVRVESEGSIRSYKRGYSTPYYTWSGFHKAAVGVGGKLERNCYPPLKTWMGWGQMVGAGSKVYIIGGHSRVGIGKEEEEEEEDVERAFVLDTEAESMEWNHYPLPLPPEHYRSRNHRRINRCASLDGKIYMYGWSGTYPPEFLAAVEDDRRHGRHPSNAFWDFIWSPPGFDDQCDWSGVAVTDPANKRILVHFAQLPLCEYYPDDRILKPLGDHPVPLLFMCKVIAVGDDVVYIYQDNRSSDDDPVLCAFDVSAEGKGKPLEVEWTSTVVVREDGTTHYLTFNNYRALFHMGRGNLLFVATKAGFLEDQTPLYLIKFKATRCSNNTSKIICTPLTVTSHLLDAGESVIDFFMLP